MVHQQPGLGITFTSEADVVAMGRSFHQRAVLWIQDDNLWLVSCVDEHREVLGHWRERLV